MSDASLENPTPSPPPRDVDLLVVGGGIMGLAIAYHYARRGGRDVAVVERGYLAGGASGRNGGGIRMQWSTEMNVRLMRESIELCKGFAKDLGVNVWLRQGGYLFLARTARTRAAMEKNVALQNRFEVPTELLAPAEARAIVPDLDVSNVIAASWNPLDGVIFPWPFLWGYATRAMSLGVSIHTFTDVTAIRRERDAFHVETTRGPVRARRLLNAAGAWSPQVARLLGLELPNHPHRHEILSTEPLKPFLGPMVSVLESGLYFSQSMRGEIVTGVTVPDESRPDGPDDHEGGARDPKEVRMGSRLRFLRLLAREITAVMPRLAGMRVLRQWAGPYDISPDGNPIVGEHPECPGLFLCCGFMGHGFMMAPVVGRYYGEWLAGGDAPPFLHKWRLARFAEGDVERESLIIG